MYHLATYPLGWLTVWKSDAQWDKSLHRVDILKRVNDDKIVVCPCSEESFMLAGYVIYSSESYDDILVEAMTHILSSKG